MLPAAGTKGPLAHLSVQSTLHIFFLYPFTSSQPDLEYSHIKPTLTTFHCTLPCSLLIFYRSPFFSMAIALQSSLEEAASG